MISITSAQLATWLSELFWPFVRIGACLMVAPVFSAIGVPARIRIVLAAAIALAVAPLVPPLTGIEPFSAAGVIVTVQQLLIGVAFGFCLQITFDAVTLGGQLLANSMGLSFAFNVDPEHGTSTPVVGQLYGILVLLIFLALDGHLRIIETLAASFRALPVGTAGLGANGLWQIAVWGAQLFAGAVAIALPGVTAITIVNLAFGVVSRAAPTLNIQAIGFPISLLFGLCIVFASLAMVQTSFVGLIGAAFAQIQRLAGPGV